MPEPDDIAGLQTRLRLHRQTLAYCLDQQAALGSAHAPPGVAAGIRDARESIAHCKAALRRWGVGIEDHPDDVGPGQGDDASQRVEVSGGSVGQVIGVQNNYYAAAGRPPDRDRMAVIARVRLMWAGADARIALSLAERPGAVALPPVALRYQELRRPPIALPPGAPIAKVFDDAGGALLILGAAGAGKTTLLRELCAALLDRAEADEGHPIPVIFNLSSWAGRRGPLDRWLVGELRSLYDVPRRLAESWVGAGAILPLLDGLDEVPGAQREACAGAINAHRGERTGPIVVCSRLADHEALTTRLRLEVAVAVLPLADEQVDAYLEAGGGRLEGLRRLVADDAALRELMRAPLLLGVADVGAAALSRPRAGQGWQTALWDAYLAVVIGRRGAMTPRGRREALGRLGQLAQLMLAHGQSVFLIERIQPQWLRSRGLFGLAWAGSLLLGLALLLGAVTLLGALVGALLMPWATLDLGWVTGVGAFAAVGLLGGVLGWVTLVISGVPGGALLAEVEPFERINLSWKGVSIGALAWAMLSGLLFWIDDLGVIATLSLALIPSYVFAIGAGITGGAMPTTERPNEGIWRAVWVTGLVGLAAGMPLFALALVAGFEGPEGFVDGSILALVGVGVGFGVGMAKGGASVMKHIVVRGLLAAAGQLPWSVQRALDTGVDRLILRRVGGGYLFTHRLLMEHLAKMGDGDIERVAAESELGAH